VVSEFKSSWQPVTSVIARGSVLETVLFHIFINDVDKGISPGQAAQGCCGVSFSGDIQDPPGQGPLQPTVGDPASAGGLD